MRRHTKSVGQIDTENGIKRNTIDCIQVGITRGKYKIYNRIEYHHPCAWRERTWERTMLAALTRKAYGNAHAATGEDAKVGKVGAAQVESGSGDAHSLQTVPRVFSAFVAAQTMRVALLDAKAVVSAAWFGCVMDQANLLLQVLPTIVPRDVLAKVHQLLHSRGHTSVSDLGRDQYHQAMGTEAFDQTDRNELAEKLARCEEKLARCQEELATERARSLEERISLEVASEISAAADDDEPEVEDRTALEADEERAAVRAEEDRLAAERAEEERTATEKARQEQEQLDDEQESTADNQIQPESKTNKPKKARKSNRRKKSADSGKAVQLEIHLGGVVETNEAFVKNVGSECDKAEAPAAGEKYLVVEKCNVLFPILMITLSVLSGVGDRSLREIEVVAAKLGDVLKADMIVTACAQGRALGAVTKKTAQKIANIKKQFACGDVNGALSLLLHAFHDPDKDEIQSNDTSKDPDEEAAKAAAKRYGKSPKDWMSLSSTTKSCQTIMPTFTNLLTMIRVYRQVTLDELIDSCRKEAKRRMKKAKEDFENALCVDGYTLVLGDMTIFDLVDEYILRHTRPSADANIRLLAIALMGEVTTRLGYQEWSHLFINAEAVPLTNLFDSFSRGEIETMAESLTEPFFDDQPRRKRAARTVESLLYVHQAAKAIGQNKPLEERRDAEYDLPLSLLCYAPSNFEGTGLNFLSDPRLQSDEVDETYVEELLDVETDCTESEAVSELYKSLRSALSGGQKEHLFTDISDDLKNEGNATESLLSSYFDLLPRAIESIYSAGEEEDTVDDDLSAAV